MWLTEIIFSIGAILVGFLLLVAHESDKVHKRSRHHRRRTLEHGIRGVEKSKVNKALAIAFITLIGLLTMPLIVSSATGEIAIFDGRFGILTLFAFFTAAYAVIVIHSVLGRD